MLLIEMAFDFDQWGVHDPHDPKFQTALAGRKILLFFGTSTNQFWHHVRNGFTAAPLKRREHNAKNEFQFEQREACYQARSKAGADGGQPILFVLEVPIAKLPKVDKTKDFLRRAGVMPPTAPLIPLSVPPKYITGVVYPAEDAGREIPIRQFIKRVNLGDVDVIEPSSEPVAGRFHTATPPEWEFSVLQYLQDLLNYGRTWFHYLVDHPDQHQFNQMVIHALAGKSWYEVSNWDGHQWLAWLKKLLPDEPLDEDDEAQLNHHIEDPYYGFNRPINQVIHKYRDMKAFRQFRLGQEPEE